MKKRIPVFTDVDGAQERVFDVPSPSTELIWLQNYEEARGSQKKLYEKFILLCEEANLTRRAFALLLMKTYGGYVGAQGMSIKEIEMRTGMQPAAIRQSIRRSKKQLRALGKKKSGH